MVHVVGIPKFYVVWQDSMCIANSRPKTLTQNMLLVPVAGRPQQKLYLNCTGSMKLLVTNSSHAFFFPEILNDSFLVFIDHYVKSISFYLYDGKI